MVLTMFKQSLMCDTQAHNTKIVKVFKILCRLIVSHEHIAV